MKRWIVPALVLLLALAPVLYAPRAPMAHAVEAFGFTDVRLGGFAPFSCAKDDVFRRTWHARDRAGRPVSGAVCGGLVKGYTVRVDG